MTISTPTPARDSDIRLPHPWTTKPVQDTYAQNSRGGITLWNIQAANA